MSRTIGYIEVVVERLAGELRDQRIRPRSAGAHVRFPEDLERDRRRQSAIDSVAFLVVLAAVVLLLVLLDHPPVTP